VTWDIGLGGKDFLLESDFLKAALELSVKEFINNDLVCNDEQGIDVDDTDLTSFYSIEINNDSDLNKLKRISGNGKCRGNRTRCKKNVKKSISDAGKVNESIGFSGIPTSSVSFPENETSAHYEAKLSHNSTTKNDFCNIFLGTSIFDLFRDALITASFFNYNVDLELINDLSGSLDLNYRIEFVESSGDGLEQIQDVDFVADDPIEITTACSETQCENQRSIIRDIFLHYEITFDEEKHECLFEDINCNQEDLVIQIWLGRVLSSLATSTISLMLIYFYKFLFFYVDNYDLKGYQITHLFGELPSLTGLFLGELVFA